MKKILLMLTFFSAVTIQAQAICDYKVIDSMGVTIVAPVYGTKVLYYFDDFEKKAMAQVQWSYDESATSQCVREFEAKNPSGKFFLPELDFPNLDVDVYQGIQKGSLSIVPRSGGQFHGQTDFIPVHYRAKAELIEAIKLKKNLLTVHGKLNFQYEVLKRELIAEFDCSKGNQSSGVIALHGRLGDLLQRINSVAKNEKVDRDQVLENFMGACVDIKDEESRGSVGLSRKVKLTRGKMPIFGLIKKYISESTFPSQITESSFVEF